MISNKGLNSKEAFDESTATSSSVRLSGARREKEKDIQEYRIDPGNSDEGRDQPKPPLLTLAFNAARLASRIAAICFRMRARQLLWQQEAVRALHPNVLRSSIMHRNLLR
jgi:hypothetical protein